MGMYTEIFFRVELQSSWAEDVRVKNAIAAIRGDTPSYLQRADLPEHEFFDSHRWSMISTGSSYYFPFANHDVWEEDPNQKGIYWSFRANLKNYDGEISKFFDWIDPYIYGNKGEFIGYELYEDADVPSLRFHGVKP